jgi:hypothetical protein
MNKIKPRVRVPLHGESWLLASVDGRYEIQRIDETCHDSYSDADALAACITQASDGDIAAVKALLAVNFQRAPE